MAKRKRSSKAAIDDQKLRLEYLDPKSLRANQKNWRTHPRRQRQAYNALKDKVGYAGSPLLNETTGVLLDGHMRVDEAIKGGETEIPVMIGSWTEEQENLILAHLDPIAALAGKNNEAFESLREATKKSLQDLKDERNRKLQQLSQDIASREDTAPLLSQGKSIRKPKELEPEILDNADDATDEEVEYQPPPDRKDVRKEIIDGDVFFPGVTNRVSLPLQLPELDPEMLATPDMAPRTTFDRSRGQKYVSTMYYCVGAVPYPPDEKKDGGVLGFFTEDYRFVGTYDFADKYLEGLLEEDWTALVAPEFSTYDDWPLPLRLFNVYKNRWCARYWQDAGFYVIPSIQFMTISETVDLTQKIIIETLPTPCPVLACQLRSNTDIKNTAKLLNIAIELLQVQTLVIYGGDDKKKFIHGYLSDQAETIYLPSFISSRRKVLKSTR